MDTGSVQSVLANTLRELGRLPSDDLPAVEALAATMAGWGPADLELYREAVLDEVAALGRRPVAGFLAIEVAALLSVECRPV